MSLPACDRSLYMRFAVVLAVVVLIGSGCLTHSVTDAGSQAEWDLCTSPSWRSTLVHNIPEQPIGWESLAQETAYDYWVWEHSISIEVGASSPPYSIHTIQSRHVSVQASGSATVKVVGGGWRFVGDRDRARWEAAGRPELSLLPEGHGWDFDVDHYDLGILHGTLLDVPNIRSMPSDRVRIDGMYERALGEPSPSRSADELESLGQLLAIGPVPARPRMALWETLAFLPYLQCDGPGIDRVGRVGVVLRVRGPQYVSEVLVDLKRNRVLEERRVALGPLPFADATRGEYLLRNVFLIPGLDHLPRDGVLSAAPLGWNDS